MMEGPGVRVCKMHNARAAIEQCNDDGWAAPSRYIPKYRFALCGVLLFFVSFFGCSIQHTHNRRMQETTKKKSREQKLLPSPFLPPRGVWVCASHHHGCVPSIWVDYFPLFRSVREHCRTINKRHNIVFCFVRCFLADSLQTTKKRIIHQQPQPLLT